MKQTLEDQNFSSKLSESDKKKITDKLTETQHWLDSNQTAEKEEYEQKQKDLEHVINPIMQSMSGGNMPGNMPGGMPGFPGGFPGGNTGFPGGNTGNTGNTNGPTQTSNDDSGPKIEEID